MFDEKAERLIIQAPFEGQGGPIREHITRKQAERFFARRNAVQAALRIAYKGKGDTVYDHIMAYLVEGFTEVEKLPAGRLRLKKDNETVLLTRKVETDLVRVQLDLEPLARNY